MLSRLKLQRGGLDDTGVSNSLDRFVERVDPALRVLGLISTIICISAAINMFFVYTMLGVFLVVLAMKGGDQIVDVLKPALAAAAFSAIIMVPAVFMGQTTSLVRVALKVFLSVGLVVNQSRGVAYNEFIAGLRTYHVPGLVIFVFDIALKYIVLLGDVAAGALESLMLRSVGRNRDKRGSSAGVMGITFLKAHDYAGEMYEAMECRGFTGEYIVPSRNVMNVSGAIYLVLIAAELLYFLLMEGII